MSRLLQPGIAWACRAARARAAARRGAAPRPSCTRPPCPPRSTPRSSAPPPSAPSAPPLEHARAAAGPLHGVYTNLSVILARTLSVTDWGRSSFLVSLRNQCLYSDCSNKFGFFVSFFVFRKFSSSIVYLLKHGKIGGDFVVIISMKSVFRTL